MDKYQSKIRKHLVTTLLINISVLGIPAFITSNIMLKSAFNDYRTLIFPVFLLYAFFVRQITNYFSEKYIKKVYKEKYREDREKEILWKKERKLL